ncbi:MAG: 4-alpha-glucanotransferase [Bacteroidota bacterium]
MRFPRSSGILLHPTSLPGQFGSGDLGAPAYHFVDWLVAAGQSIWQMLPLGPAGLANSPYMSHSAFAGSPLLIDLQELVSHGWLTQEDLCITQGLSAYRVNYSEVTDFRMRMLAKASEQFFKQGTSEDMKQYVLYCAAEKSWLDDYALFQALNHKHGEQEWSSWDANLAHREPNALKKASEELHDSVAIHKFTQWCFARQWSLLKKYANDRNVIFVGDIPIFVAYHSADVWAHPKEFHLDKDGMPTVVAGVPPDYFSKTGQRWGNPLYRWDVIKETKYQWWIERFRKTFALFDVLRIDHFRGFETYWEIPEEEETAEKGRWVKGPGEEFFKNVQRKLGTLPIIAEDLGIITTEVHALREKLEFPGMKVLQFAFNSGPENAFLPHRYEPNCVVYTGTHDNDTTRGWYEKTSNHERDFVRRYCKTDGKEIQWDFIKLALESVADIAVIPYQDVIGLGSEGRMNIPGTIEGNWEWRFTWDQVGTDSANRLYELTALYGRCNPDRLNLLS